MPNKKLYVVSSLHSCTDAESNSEYHVPEILKIRLNFIGALAKTTGKGAYFSDGIYLSLADRANRILQKYSSA